MATYEFHKTVTAMRNSLRPYAIKLTQDSNNADDLLQDTILKALANEDKFKHNTNLRAWMLVIMRNIFINNYRKKSRQKTVLDNSETNYLLNNSQTVDNKAITNFVMEDIYNAIRAIPQKLQRPILMIAEGFKYQEIATVLDIPVGTAKSRVFMARKQLQKSLSIYR